MKRNLWILWAIVFTLGSCKDLIEPDIENNRNLEDIYKEANYAQGLLLNAYTRIPTSNWSFNDLATDDAVSNDEGNSFLKIATGQWTAYNNPLDQWQNGYAAIQYLNILLAEADKVKWAEDVKISAMFNDRMKGEAYALRALFMFHLLQAHAGPGADGRLLGVPLLLAPQSTVSDFNKPRESFADCMKQLYADIDKAVDLLPTDFEDIGSDDQVPAKYAGASKDNYNRVFGQFGRLRITGRIIKAIRSQAALLAASPAYNTGNTNLWVDAANYAGEVLALHGGLNGLAANGCTWYTNISEINGLGDGLNPPEVLWRGNFFSNSDLEQANYPPTLYGKGLTNPSQNLVNAFPMANGYPISDLSNSGYNASSPYKDRDPRLTLFILVNGGTAGPSGTVIKTAVDGGTNDALNKVETSTRTGYYLKKLLRNDVNTNPTTPNVQRHYKPRIRYTEIFLNYAEAANEAWGPSGTGSYGYSAYDVIKAIRARAGVGAGNGDAYLQSIAGNKDQMSALIRNERRLELCFEGFRFWDLRRWNLDLTETARGISIKSGTYQFIDVEKRNYQSFMNFGPIPNGEIIKYSNLVQNQGW